MIFSEIRNHVTNEFAGVVVLKLSVETLKEICFDFEGMGNTGEMILVQKRDTAIMQILPTRFAEALPLAMFKNPELPVYKALAGQHGQARVTDYRNKQVLAVWKPVPEYGWGVVIKQDTSEAFLPVRQMRRRILLSTAILLLAALMVAHLLSRSIARPINTLSDTFRKISKGEHSAPVAAAAKDEIGDLSRSANQLISYFETIKKHAARVGAGDYSSNFISKGETDELGNALHQMTENLRKFARKNEQELWMQQSLSILNTSLQGNLTIAETAEKSLTSLAHLLDARAAVLYTYAAEQDSLQFCNGYALQAEEVPPQIRAGHGMAGQAIKERRICQLQHAPHDYLKIRSALGETGNCYTVVVPLQYKDALIAVTELASLQEFSELKIRFLQQASEIVAIAMNTAKSRQIIQELLEESQAQTEELSAQQEELHQQTQKLLASEEELRSQQEELMVNNKELEEKSFMLEQKAKELEQISQYKSEFLANMSHELRTPLNSIMLLSRLLTDNPGKNLTEEQTEYASIIHQSGNNLLELINDILDITKIESGRIEVHLEKASIEDICKSLDNTFMALARQKGIAYSCSPQNEIPNVIITDAFRVDQILKNIVSNAFKFTEKGSVSITVGHMTVEEAVQTGLPPVPMIRFQIKDTGIGIDPEKQERVFDAFWQGDGSVRRKYGGTGLGLSISKKLALLLGGDITCESEAGKGSVFTLFTPADSSMFVSSGSAGTHEAYPLSIYKGSAAPAGAGKDIKKQHNRVLIIEDNENHLLALQRFLETEFIAGIAARSAKDAYALLETNDVNCIILDMGLPDENGYQVMEKIRETPALSHIPILVYTGLSISAAEEQKIKRFAERIIIKTANSYQRLKEELKMLFSRPASKEPGRALYKKDEALVNKNILVVDDDVRNIYSLTKLLESNKMNVITAINGREALQALKDNSSIDLVLMDIMMPDLDGYSTIKELRSFKEWEKLPVIALTAKAMPGDREKCIRAGASDYISKPVDAEQLFALLRIWLYK